MTWVKIETCTPDKPEVFSIADKLSIDPDAVLGKLVRIWIWADQHTTDGNARSVTRALLDRLASVTGFADAMVASGWLVETADGVQFVNFTRHNGQTAKTRALTAERVAKSRSRNADVTTEKPSSNGVSVTESLPDKIREEKNKERQGKSSKRTKSQAFQVPTFDEVEIYIEEHAPGVNAEVFYRFYESKGWMVGKNKMKNWKACVATWKAKDPPKKKRHPATLEECDRIFREQNGL